MGLIQQSLCGEVKNNMPNDLLKAKRETLQSEARTILLDVISDLDEHAFVAAIKNLVTVYTSE